MPHAIRALFLISLNILAPYLAFSESYYQEELDIPTSEVSNESWDLIWHDEFDGKSLDMSKWSYGLEGKRGEGLWSRKNVFLSGDGYLIFRASTSGDTYVGAGIDTYRHFETLGGFFSFRCKLPKLPGFRPAIWLTTPNVEAVGNDGVDGTEIDIMEQPGRHQVVHLNLHWDGYGEQHKTIGTTARLIGSLDEWHTFSLYWSAAEYVFYVDNLEAWRTSAGGVSKVPQFIRLGIETPWRPSAFAMPKSSNMDYFVCDYARVYRRRL